MVAHPDSPVREDDATGPATDVDADPPCRRRERHDCSSEKNQKPGHTDIDARGKRLESTQGPPGGLQLAKRGLGRRVPTCAPPTSRRLLRARGVRDVRLIDGREGGRRVEKAAAAVDVRAAVASSNGDGPSYTQPVSDVLRIED